MHNLETRAIISLEKIVAWERASVCAFVGRKVHLLGQFVRVELIKDAGSHRAVTSDGAEGIPAH